MTDSSRIFGDISECGRALGSLRACPLAADLEAFLLAVNGLRADLAAHRSARPAAEVNFSLEGSAGGVREAVCEVRRAEAALALAKVLSAQASGAAPEVIALLQARSSLASLCAEQAASLLGSCPAPPACTLPAQLLKP